MGVVEVNKFVKGLVDGVEARKFFLEELVDICSLFLGIELTGIFVLSVDDVILVQVDVSVRKVIFDQYPLDPTGMLQRIAVIDLFSDLEFGALVFPQLQPHLEPSFLALEVG